MIVLWRKHFSEKCISKSGMTIRNPKKNLRKGSWEWTGGTVKWERLRQIEIRGTGGTGTGGSPYCVGQDGTGTGECSDSVGKDGTGTGGSSD